MSLIIDPLSGQPTELELEHTELYGKYMLSKPMEIVFVLRSMQKNGCMATVYYNHGSSFLLSAILAVDGDEMSVILDVGGDEEVNSQALQASRLVVTARLDSVKVQFALNGLKPTTFDGRPAFLASLPETLLRLQRREYFRLETPLADPLRCRVPLPVEGRSTYMLDAILLDISCGGLSLMIPIDLAERFQVGMLYRDCHLEIPSENAIAVTLSIHRSFIVSPRDGRSEYLLAGCEFVAMPGTRLATIQRYITRIERERKARQSGFN